MKKQSEFNVVMNMIAARGHAAPVIDVLKGELRSDYGFEPAPQPQQSASGLANMHVTWRYRLLVGKREDFCTFLGSREEAMAAAINNLGVGTKYLGTYAVLPNANVWQTIWTYDDVNAIDAFKQRLKGGGSTQLKKDVKKLASFVDPATLEIERMGLARGVIAPTINGTLDPVLELFGD